MFPINISKSYITSRCAYLGFRKIDIIIYNVMQIVIMPRLHRARVILGLSVSVKQVKKELWACFYARKMSVSDTKILAFNDFYIPHVKLADKSHNHEVWFNQQYKRRTMNNPFASYFATL